MNFIMCRRHGRCCCRSCRSRCSIRCIRLWPSRSSRSRFALFGDNPLGWRYPAALFGALAIVAVYLCGLALFAAQGPAIAAALIAFFNQMLFVEARTAMLDIFALTFGLFGTAAFLYGFRKTQPFGAFALAGLVFGLAAACKWSGLFPLAACLVIVAAIRLMQSWRTQFADPTPATGTGRISGPISGVSCRDLLRACAGAYLFRELRAAVRLLAARPDRGAAARSSPTTPRPRLPATPI